ncbi:FAD-binding oxidoreductase [Dyella jejuensis]|uniref:FAD-binding oxidoreductase n=2 Tax=Dyella jejuensis TaxID=1432009 RepID=A0ABW8JHR2_9GAMM
MNWKSGISFLAPFLALLRKTRRSPPKSFRRVRPGDPEWPAASAWEGLNTQVGGRLLKVSDPLAACRADPYGKACRDLFANLRNPYYILDQVNLTQTSGWARAWTSQPSAYAVVAESAVDVAAAVNFAREHRLRLVVKGTGHSYKGTSNAPDSLLIWTRNMRKVQMHDAFVPQGCMGKVAPQPAVSCDAGCIWGHTYNEVTTKGGRYVQGGDCMTVGVAGLISSGGFGAWSKRYGTAAANLLEAEVVTADGRIRVVNACNDPELFWALKGGGGGSFGVITRLTLRTFELPAEFGTVDVTVRASSKSAYRRLIGQFVSHYREYLFNPHWGDQVQFLNGHILRINMSCQGLDQAQMEAAWKPFSQFLRSSSDDYAIPKTPGFAIFPARTLWDPRVVFEEPDDVISDSRPGAPIENFVWAGDEEEAGRYIHGWGSAWLPEDLLQPARQEALADALFAASQQGSFVLQFKKALAGGDREQIEASRDTATNPQVLKAFALALVGDGGPPAFAGIPGHEPPSNAHQTAAGITRIMDALYKLVPDAGTYVSESDYFLKDWQRAFWGSNYPRLKKAKDRYDPDGLFTVHHGVGSEDWSDDGFTRHT